MLQRIALLPSQMSTNALAPGMTIDKLIKDEIRMARASSARISLLKLVTRLSRMCRWKFPKLGVSESEARKAPLVLWIQVSAQSRHMIHVVSTCLDFTLIVFDSA